MRIYSSKRDDILKEREEYRRQRSEAQSRYDSEHEKYYEARDAVLRPIKTAILSALARFDKLQFDVSVNEGWTHNNELEVFIQCNRRHLGDEDSALTWDYRARIDHEGEVLIETSSWSGMNATTYEHIDQLRQTADALEMLMGIDWKYVLTTQFPSRDEFISTFPIPSKDSDFSNQLAEAEIEELIGTRIGIRGRALYNTGYREGVPGYYIIEGETPSRYKAVFLPEYYLKSGSAEDIQRMIGYGPKQFKKDNLIAALERKPVDSDSDSVLITREF